MQRQQVSYRKHFRGTTVIMNQIAALEKREVEASKVWVGNIQNSVINFESGSEKADETHTEEKLNKTTQLLPAQVATPKAREHDNHSKSYTFAGPDWQPGQSGQQSPQKKSHKFWRKRRSEAPKRVIRYMYDYEYLHQPVTVTLRAQTKS